MADPDYIYDPDDWEYTSAWEDRADLAEDAKELRCPGDIKRYETLIKGPDKFAAQVPTDIGEDGDVHEWELRWFDSEDEARKACGLPEPAPAT